MENRAAVLGLRNSQGIAPTVVKVVQKSYFKSRNCIDLVSLHPSCIFPGFSSISNPFLIVSGPSELRIEDSGAHENDTFLVCICILPDASRVLTGPTSYVTYCRHALFLMTLRQKHKMTYIQWKNSVKYPKI